MMSTSDIVYTKDRKRMVENQIQARGIQDTRVLAAMQTVPRHTYIPENRLSLAYEDCPMPIGYGQTISQPYIVGLMTSLLALQHTETVLEIGTGSGYQTAVLSLLCKQVYSIELIPQLSLHARQVNDSHHYTNITYLIADGSLGWPGQQQFDAILVTAGAPLVPQALFNQLTPQGRLLIPVGDRYHQTLEYWQRIGEELIKKEHISVVFVPLKGRKGWQ